jgi:hypothetical protein
MRHQNKNVIVKNLTLAETIAHRNPEIANEMLILNGYPHSPDRDVLAKQLNHFLLTQREKALKELANVHPDKELISSMTGDEYNNADGDGSEEMPVKRRPNGRGSGRHHNADGDEYSNCCGHHAADGYSNCSGCGGSCGGGSIRKFNGGSFNADGDKAQTAALVNKEMLAIVGVIGLITVTIIALSRSKA